MTDTAERRQTIHRFVRKTALRRRLWFLLASFASHGLAVGVVLYLVDWIYPSIHPQVLFAGFLWLGVVLVWHLLNPGLSLRSADGTLGLQDRLMTWWSRRQQQEDDATRWLEQDLCTALTDLPPEKHGQLWRRPMRRLLWVLPLLLLVWWIGPIGQKLFMGSPTGVTKEANRGTVTQTGGQEPGGKPDPSKKGDRSQPKKQPDPNKPGEDPKGKQPQPEKPQPKKPQPKKPDPKKPGEQPNQQDKPPKPILALPGAEEFIVPDFVGEGDGKKQKTRIAVIEEPDRGKGARGGKSPPATGGKGARPPQAETREYEKAAEAAQRSRHVPENERAFVKRYFDELLGKRRQP